MALMAKQVRRPSDPTVAASLDGGQTVAAPIDGGQTSAVPNTRPTDKVELAWSTGDVPGGDDLADHDVPEKEPQSAVVGQSWGATVRIASLLVAGCLVLAGAIVFGRWALTSDKSPTQAPPAPSATSAPSASAAGVAPSPSISPQDQDNKFIQILNAKGITGLDPAQTIGYGRQICQDLGRGATVGDETEAFRKANEVKNPTLAAQAGDFVNASIQVYCPQIPH
jgi:Protein of unknown function (DUF732)